MPALVAFLMTTVDPMDAVNPKLRSMRVTAHF